MTKYNSMSILRFLPQTFFSDNSIILSVLTTQNTYLKNYYEFYQNVANLSDPMLIDASLLDWLAMKTINPWRNLWDTSWAEITKRKLLRDTTIIFKKRLFTDVINLLFSHFNLDAKLLPTTGFILGTVNPPASPLPATLGTGIYNFYVSLPARYSIGSPQYIQVQWIVANFGLPINIPIRIDR